jgi:hypothetical protein
MGQSRHGLPAAIPLALALFVAAAAGCGSGEGGATSERAQPAAPGAGAPPPGASARTCAGAARGFGALRVAGVGCATGRGVVASWSERTECAPAAGASRVSCGVGGYRCLGAVTDRGIAVSCARHARSISFVAKRG